MDAQTMLTNHTEVIAELASMLFKPNLTMPDMAAGLVKAAIKDFTKGLGKQGSASYTDYSVSDENRLTGHVVGRPLHYKDRNSEFLGRGKEMARLRDFCGVNSEGVLIDKTKRGKRLEHTPQFLWWCVTGKGGTGKSRLALEFGEWMRNDNNWDCHLLTTEDLNELDALFNNIDNKKQGTLYIYDYAEFDLQRIVEWMVKLRDSRHRVRLLLVQRVARPVDEMQRLLPIVEKALTSVERIRGRDDHCVISDSVFDKEYLELAQIGRANLGKIMETYIETVFQPKKLEPEKREELLDILEGADPTLMRPLYAMAIADAYAAGEDPRRGWKQTQVLDSLFKREVEYLSCLILEHFKDSGTREDDIETCIYGSLQMIAMATMMGGVQLQTNTLEPETLSMLRSAGVINKDGYCDALEPDIIGEYFVLNVIKEDNDALPAIIRKAWSKPYYMSRFVTKLNQDFPDEPLAQNRLLTHADLSGLRLTVIEEDAFWECQTLRGITAWPKELKEIHSYAFNNCTYLSSIPPWPERLTGIEYCAFLGCSSLANIPPWPTELTSIGESAFEGCSGLTSIPPWPSGLMSIEESAFEGCSGLTSIPPWPSILKSIEASAFSRCRSLTSIPPWPTKLTSIEKSTFFLCSGLTSIPPWPTGLTSIKGYAFCFCSSLANIPPWPAELKSIEDSAFFRCRSLTSIPLWPESLKEIGSDAFRNCHGLTIIPALPKRRIHVEFNAFGNKYSILPWRDRVRYLLDMYSLKFKVCRLFEDYSLKLRRSKYDRAARQLRKQIVRHHKLNNLQQ
ncbi:hypothetical protein FACS1894184_07730 [Clostridia bacterium]|nr:hypothetical protein FACS1894184_07730 [Clostridia bacterium]